MSILRGESGDGHLLGHEIAVVMDLYPWLRPASATYHRRTLNDVAEYYTGTILPRTVYTSRDLHTGRRRPSLNVPSASAKSLLGIRQYMHLSLIHI